ncbi:hypothetical protein LPB67_03925 [Undibacterium sp. Jales W-56]|uniref:tetratricopeptide repeat protein n=1 Tax=Undibacterium sp. Jales W-56 TaxID=2897325 RepID=UPI0021D1B2DD|nr:hypothetical protein [Undibacterium sp. Jales W-56]MCU6432924.1 hypothetical protein [Undibacterium sp. Jales W-56]
MSACVTDPVKTGAPLPIVKIETMMADAELASAAGQQDKALAILKNATNTFPTDKAPWAQMAQMKFDTANYAEAVMNAQEVLQRDPVDKLANSIIAVSGLRLSTKALTDLSQQNNLTGSLRTEAQDLAKLLRESLGENLLVPAKNKSASNSAPRPSTTKPSNVGGGKVSDKDQGSSNPFGVLK